MQKFRILIIDDIKENVFALTVVLEKNQEFEIVGMSSAIEALSYVEKNVVDLMLCDIQMPSMDGFEFVSLIRLRKKTASIPVIFVSGHHKEQAFFQRARDLGAIEYLVKPIDEEELIHRINTYYTFAMREHEKKRELAILNSELAIANEQAQLIDTANAPIFGVDAKGAVNEWNKKSAKITGFHAEEVLGKSLVEEFIPIDYRELVNNVLQKALQGESTSNFEFELYTKDSNLVRVLLNATTRRNASGDVVGVIGVGQDVTQIKAYQSQLEQMAHYDTLTKLPNRVLLAARLHQAIAQSKRHNDLLAVLFLDIDGFKYVNDTHGDNVGDKALVALAIRMKESLQDGDILARIGGDEFVAVLVGLPTAEDSVPALEQLLLAASEPIEVDDVVLNVTVSIGVTFYPKDYVDADLLMRHADQAMYAAKESGKNCYHLFDTAQDNAVNAHQKSLESIRSALDNHQFLLHYQPKVNMWTGTVVGVEALIRWQHPEKGILSPLEFLPTIENNSMMIELGEWVIDSALTQISQWQIMGFTHPISISVNIAAVQIQAPSFTQRLTILLAGHPDVEPRFLELEVLETSAIDDVLHISKIMNDCIALGVSFALDDFGTGYSSLTHLRRLPASVIKVDQTFVRDMLDDVDDLAIVEGVISLAKSFKRDVIAEGVESIAHGKILLEMGCELAQGYGIARPMPASDIPKWVNDWEPDDTWRS